MSVACLIIDDEPLAIEAIEMHLEAFKDIEVAGTCTNAVDAFELLRRKKTDLIFLDIQMPKMTGLEFLRSLTHPPKVIITTAFSEYALDGYELDVVDYLLKPISFDRFMAAIDKFYRLREHDFVVVNNPADQKESGGFMYVRADRMAVKITFDSILYLESLKDYVRIVTDKKTVTTKSPLGKFEEQLPESIFQRIHRSYIVALSRVEAFNAHSVFIGKKELPLAKAYKDQLLRAMQYHKKLI